MKNNLISDLVENAYLRIDQKIMSRIRNLRSAEEQLNFLHGLEAVCDDPSYGE